MQWADAGLIDFLEYLLDWSSNHALFVLALARPDFTEKRSSWGGKRNFSSLYLEPLVPQAMTDLLAGLVPGLPVQVHAEILDRAEGSPLYAVRTGEPQWSIRRGAGPIAPVPPAEGSVVDPS